MNIIKITFKTYNNNQIRDWLINNVGEFKFRVDDILFQEVGQGWSIQLEIKNDIYWLIEIADDEKAVECKLRFL